MDSGWQHQIFKNRIMEKVFDEEQLKAINAQGGYYLVLAPPGCGKTDILSERIAKAHGAGVAFEDMLCLTFTNRASRGMMQRIRDRVGGDSKNVFVGNVHRYCSNFLFENALVKENSCIIDEDDVADILLSFDLDFFSNRGKADKKKVSLVDRIESYISQKEFSHPQTAIYSTLDIEQYYVIAKQALFDPLKIPSDQLLVKYALMYRNYKHDRNFISFSDILILAYEHLRNDLTGEFKRFKWIQVDEVQDLNALQTSIIDELTDKTEEFTVMYLGDEQQAIFSFMGAKLDQLEFLKKRCHGNILTLGKNYRSPKYLLDVFNTFAEKELHVNPELLPKPQKIVVPEKFSLVLTGNPKPEKEEQRVSDMIKYYLKFDEERMAVLVPTNDAADRISQKLNKEGVSHFKISGVDMFKTKSYKTLSSFFCLLANEFNTLAWVRFLYGTGAISRQYEAREFLVKLKRLMMTPTDLFHPKSYLAQFADDYRRREFVFFDTETTGLNVLEDDIVQIAAFKVRDGEKVEGSDLNIVIHTDKEIPAKLGDKVNPLVAEYESSYHYSREEGLNLFLDYIGDDVLLGHNVNYDYQILQNNVQNYLNEQIQYDVYDSLRLIKSVEPELRRYKLEYLLEELHLEGVNSHLANEDIEATKNLVDYCWKKIQMVLPDQYAFVNLPEVQAIASKMKNLKSLFEMLQSYMYVPTTVLNRTIADELKNIYEVMIHQKLIKDLSPKFDIFLQYVQNEWVDFEETETLNSQICKHCNDLSSSISEGDLINSSELLNERVFIMTVHKGKGLEFDNVVILQANDGVYPYYTVNKVLSCPCNYSQKEVNEARQERMENARKFYVALSRAKKRLCVSYSLMNTYGYPTTKTPFMECIQHYFYRS